MPASERERIQIDGGGFLLDGVCHVNLAPNSFHTRAYFCRRGGIRRFKSPADLLCLRAKI